jgi:hypothetical protein
MRGLLLILAAGLLGACGTLLDIAPDPDPTTARSDAGTTRDAEGGVKADASNDASNPPTDASFDVDAARPRPIAFVSSQTAVGYAGRSAFDAMCQQLATSAGLPGSYAALVGTPTASPVGTLRSTTWYRPDGQLLFDGTLAMPRMGFVTETAGAPGMGELVWTGAAVSNCVDWSDGGLQGGHGNPNAATPAWLAFGSSTCTIGNHVYCFEQ